MCHGRGSGTPQAEEGNTTVEGTRGKVQTHRRGKVPLLGGQEEEGQTAIGNSLCQSVHMPVALRGWGGSGAGYRQQKASCLFRGDWAFLVQAMSGQAPLVWAKGIRGLSATWCLLHNLQVAGTDSGGHLRGQMEAWLATTGDL